MCRIFLYWLTNLELMNFQGFSYMNAILMYFASVV